MRVEVRNLSKVYPGGTQALEDVSLEISSGMFGLLGPNGAGKSTLMKILATLETPSSGEVRIDGADINTHRREVRSSLGYLPQFFGAYPQITGAEFISYVAKLKGVGRRQLGATVNKGLANVGLLEARDRKVKTYSGGMMRRLGIAQALVGDSTFLIIDEPTVGLDPEERIRFRNLLTDISEKKVIILSTHIVGDISSTCQDLALLAHGRVVFRGRPQELLSQASGQVWQLECDETEFPDIASRTVVISTISTQQRLELRVVGDRLTEYAMRPVSPNLEDAYMYFMERVVGERLDQEA